MTFFDHLNAINDTKQNLLIDDLTEKEYNPYMVNRSLSFFPDTILLANEMNRLYQVDKKLQFDFLLCTVRKRKRFSKWFKPEKIEDLDVIKKYFNYSDEKARSALKILSADQVSQIKSKMTQGGRKR